LNINSLSCFLFFTVIFDWIDKNSDGELTREELSITLSKLKAQLATMVAQLIQDNPNGKHIGSEVANNLTRKLVVLLPDSCFTRFLDECLGTNSSIKKEDWVAQAKQRPDGAIAYFVKQCCGQTFAANMLISYLISAQAVCPVLLTEEEIDSLDHQMDSHLQSISPRRKDNIKL